MLNAAAKYSRSTSRILRIDNPYSPAFVAPAGRESVIDFGWNH